RAYDRARWRHLARRLSLGIAPPPLLSAGTGILQVVPRTDACEAPRSASGRPAAVLQPVCPSRRTQGVRELPRAAAQAQMVCLLKTPVRRTRGGARLSVALHPPCCHLQSPADRSRPERCHVQLQGLSYQRPSAPQSHDARNKRVYPPLPYPRPAEGLPSHSL